MSNRSLVVLVTLAGLCAVPTALGTQPAKKQPVNPAITREGSGPRRDALTARELEPYDATIWSKVTSWVEDKAPTPADLSGQVVLVCTWKYYHPASKRGMEGARKLAEQFAGKGLVVVAIHDSQNWDEAQKAAALRATANKDVKFFVGYDQKGDFRKAVDSDGDPDFYIIDRAGQLRYADIATESVEPALTALVAETPEKAAAIKSDLAKEKEKRDREAARSSDARNAVDMTSIPSIPPGFTAPTAESFAAIRWPATIFQTLEENSSSSSGEPKPAPVIQLPEGEGWIGGRPELQGRVWVVYFWSLDWYESYQVMQKMDQLQQARGRDVAVVGVLTRMKKTTDSSGEEKPEDPAKLLKKVQDFTRGKSLQHSTFVEPTGQLIDATRPEGNSDVLPVPYAIVCSSDGTVRFSGWAAHPSFESTLDNTLNLDPGVRARRAADVAYLKSKGK